MADRVDKSWKTKGLNAYSNAAILGTLAHYGITVEEAAFRDWASDRYPLEIAVEWNPKWKGTGQFQQFPYAAADELSRRLFPDKLTPLQLAQALIEAVSKGVQVLEGAADETGPALNRLEASFTTLPPQGDRRDAFNAEMVSFLEPVGGPFNDLPRALAQKGQRELGLKFAKVHEVVFPDREGCITALVDAMSADRTQALAKLVTWASDPARSLYQRHAAVDCLYQAAADSELKAPGIALFDACEAEGKWVLADSVAHLMANVVRRSNGADEVWAAQVVQRFTKAHHHVGDHHHEH